MTSRHFCTHSQLFAKVASFLETTKKLRAFQNQVDLDRSFKWVADSALYATEKLLAQSDYLWLTRVPERKEKEVEAILNRKGRFIRRALGSRWNPYSGITATH